MKDETARALFAETVWVRKLARQLVHSDDLADDIYQETLAAAVKSPAGSDRPWLVRVTRNLAISLLRRERRRGEVERAAAAGHREATPPSELVAEAELQRVAVNALMELDEPYRETLLLRYMKGLSVPAVASRMKVPAETVRTRLKRGLARLRERLDQRPGGRLALALPLAVPGWPHPTTATLWRTVVMKTHVGAAAASAAVLTGVFGWLALATGSGLEDRSAGGNAGIVQARTQSEAGTARAAASAVPTREPRDPRQELRPKKSESQKVTPAKAQRPGHLLVYVRNNKGKSPVQGAVVLLHERHRAVPRREVTAADGSARFLDVGPGLVKVDVDRKGHPLEARIEPGKETMLPAWVYGREVQGFVYDVHGRPVPYATVLIARLIARRPIPVITTDAHGQFSLSCVHNVSVIGASHPAHGCSDFALVQGASSVSGAKPGTVAVRLLLPGHPAAVRGVVRDRTGKPVPDAWVRIGLKDGAVHRGDPEWWRPPPAQVATDDRGRFEVQGLRPGRVPIQVYAKGHAHWFGHVDCHGHATAKVDVELLPGGNLVGRVLDVEGRPVPSAEIKLPLMTHPQLAAATSDQNGVFRIEDLPPGEIEIEIEGGNHGSTKETVAVLVGRTEHRDFQLGRGPSIRGVLRDSLGKPLSGWTVRRFQELSEKILTDDRGGFIVRDCGRQKQELEVLDPRSFCVVVALHKVTPSPKEQVFRVDVARMPSCQIRGRVVDHHGTPIKEALVEIWQSPLAPSLMVLTDEEGRFCTPRLPPGPYRLGFEQDGFQRKKTGKLTLIQNQDRDLDTVRLAPLRR